MISPAIVSFFGFLAAFVAIGLVSARKKQSTPEDYLLASRSVSPWLVALSAVATNNSGAMFIGLTGTAFTFGLKESVWLMGGWVLGDYIAWLFVHKGLHQRSAQRRVATIPQFLGGDMKHGRIVIATAALITLCFLGLYASAQLTAGRKALAIFDLDPALGVIVGAVMVTAYCFAGGIRASIWTDAAQSVVMLGAMSLLVVVATLEAGGLSQAWITLAAIDPALVDLRGGQPTLWLVPFILGWVFAGFGAVGQPHIMVRLMTLDSSDNVKKTRDIYIVWFALFSVLCVLVGLLARVLIADQVGADGELAFPMLSKGLLPEVLVGVMLAGLFAGTISTADSQVLSCSAAITQDLVPSWKHSYLAVKLGTLAVACVATTLALLGLHYPETLAGVFRLVNFSWSGLASSLGPLLVVRSLGLPISMPVALTMMLGGVATVILWDQGLGYGPIAYAALPGMLFGFVVYGAFWLRTTRAGRAARPS